MGKAALLIAVAEYRVDFESLAAAENDLQAVQRVLQLPEAGGFAADAVKTLINPGPQKMREELEGLFANRRKDDLLVLYFSGHGVTDDRGNFYLASTATQRDRIKTTAVSARLILELMEDSRSKQQVVILDCCFSGAFANEMTAKGEPVNLGSQLGGQGRAVLTSSSATEYSFEQKESQLSVYTRYLVEGLETGAADLNGDGWIDVDELYEFTRDKVQEAAPAMQPKVYAAEAGYKIRLSRAPLGDPKLEYRKEVEKLLKARGGELSPILQRGLDARRKVLKLSADDAHAIQDEVLKPYRERADKLRQYEEALLEALQVEASVSDGTREDLKYFQQVLGLRDQDISRIEAVTAEQYCKEGLARKDKEDYQGAIADYTKAIELNPDFADAYYKRGVAKGTLGDKQGAIADCTKAIELNPDYADAYTNRGNAKRALGDNQGAIADYNKAIELNPDFAIAYHNRGVAKYALGDNQGAIADFNKAIELDPDYALAYIGRGLAKRALGDNQGAIVDYTKAIELNPDFALSYSSRGFAKRALGNNQGAIDDYNKAIELNPDYADAYNNRGFSKHALGDKQGAIDDYTKAIELNPDFATAYNNRGAAKYDSGDNQGAIDDYTKAIELNPDFALAYNRRGLAKHKLGDNQGEIADFTKAIELNPDFATAYYDRGFAKIKLGDSQGGIADYTKATELNPDDADAYYFRGLAKIKLGDEQGAIADFTKAIELNPDHANAYNIRGSAKRELLDDNQDAIVDLSKAIELNPDDADAYYSRGLARIKLGDRAGAIQDYQEAADLYQQQGKTDYYQDALNQVQSLQTMKFFWRKRRGN